MRIRVLLYMRQILNKSWDSFNCALFVLSDFLSMVAYFFTCLHLFWALWILVMLFYFNQ